MALPKLPAYWFSRFSVWGYLVSCALFALSGVAGAFAPSEFTEADRAGWCAVAYAPVTVFSMLCSSAMASAMMHSITGPGGWKAPHWPTLISAFLGFIVFAVPSSEGMHLGWQVLRSEPTQVGLPNWFVVLSFTAAKLVSRLALDGREAIDCAKLDEEKHVEIMRSDRAADAERERRHKEKLARIEGKKSAIRHLKPSVATTQTDKAEPLASHNSEKSKFSLELRQQAVELLSQGQTPLEVHKHTGIPRATLKRQAWELKNGKVPRFAQ